MRVYFFGDIHGNLQALEACLSHMRREKPDAVYCLGDLAGWLPFGDRTFERLRAEGFPTVAGNHDLLIAGLITDHPEQLDRMQATAYNAGLLFPCPGAIDYIQGLPLAIEGEDFTVVHHSPFDLPAGDSAPTIHNFGYLDGKALAESAAGWARYPKRLIVSGHDHIPAVYELTAAGEILRHIPEPGKSESTVAVKENSRYWVKAGSVGGPYRDGVPFANSVLYDSQARTITLFRIAYDSSSLIRELSSHRFCANLPTIRAYIDTLRKGNPS